MNKWIIGFVIASVAAMGACAPAPAPAPEPAAAPAVDTAADEAAIKELSASLSAALTAGDVDGFVAAHAADALMMSPNRAAFNGSEEIKAWYSGMLEAFTIHWTTSSIEIVVDGDLAYELVKSEMVGELAGSTETLNQSGMGVRIYQRQADGGWKITRDIWTLDGSGTITDSAAD